MMIFVRHGERLDQVGGKHHIEYKHDPPLTAHGMKQAVEVAQMTREFLKQKGFGSAPLKFICSPHIRTLQTCAAFQYELT